MLEEFEHMELNLGRALMVSVYLLPRMLNLFVELGSVILLAIQHFLVVFRVSSFCNLWYPLFVDFHLETPSHQVIQLFFTVQVIMEIPLELMLTISQNLPWMFFPDIVPLGHPIFDIINSTNAEVKLHTSFTISFFFINISCIKDNFLILHIWSISFFIIFFMWQVSDLPQWPLKSYLLACYHLLVLQFLSDIVSMSFGRQIGT